MMMAQPFAAHQGIPQHPGLPPGHALAPGQHPNPHPGAMVQHPGVSAPVTQGAPMMAQMPPGAGTAGPGPAQAHALSHLGPQAHAMFQQPQFAQNFPGANAQMMQQHQNLLRQRMMFQAQQPQPHQQQQPQHPQQQPQQHQGLPVSLPNGTQGLNTAHMVAMHNPAMRPNMQMQQLQQMTHGQPQNLQQQQHFIAMQQAAQAQAQAQAQVQQAQAQAQAQQAQQQNAGPQPGQHTPQPRPAPQPQNIHDAQSVTPQPQPGPPPHQGSATPQPNPQQAPVSQPPQQQPVVTQPQPTPNLAPQQLPQAQPAGQQPQQHQQPQGQQPQPQQQQQQPQQVQQHPGQQQGQQHHPMAAQEAQIKAQQQQQQQNAAMLMQQQRMAMRGQSILCLGNFAEQLSSFESHGEAIDLLFWQTFVDKFYSPTGVLRQGVYNPQAGSKQFEIATPALARYYNTQFTSGIRKIQMLIEAPRERDSQNGGHIVESPRASFIYWFTNDAQLFTTGTLRAHFDIQNKIEMLDIVVMNHTEYLPRSQLQALELSEQKQSPKVTKNMGKRAQQKQPQQPTFTLPESMVTSNGVPTPVMSFLEVAETMSQMQLLFQYSQQHPNLTPSESLRSLVSNIQSQNQNPVLMQNAMNPALQQIPNARPPSIGGPNQFASPAMAHLALPGGVQGSPHLTGSAHPSPAQSNLVGPPGMGPQGQMPQNIGSASASPNVTNKRRRASTVKMEGEEGGADVNGNVPPGPAKVKASPRVGGKRQKGTAA